MSKFRILHFSDVHAGLKDFHPGYLLDKRFFGRLNQFCRRQHRLNLANVERLARLQKSKAVDFTVCTGDLSSIGSAGEFEAARELLAPVLDYAGERFLFVPGNHDAYVPQNAPALAKCFEALNGGRCALPDLPFSLTCGAVEFVALNPARPCRVWQSTGEMSEEAWQRLDYILRKPKRGAVRLLVSHFPLINHRGRKLSWRTEFIGAHEHLGTAAAERRFDGMLTGHVHYPFVRTLDGSGCLAVGAGSLTICNSCALIQVDTADGRIEAQIIDFQNEDKQP